MLASNKRKIIYDLRFDSSLHFQFNANLSPRLSLDQQSAWPLGPAAEHRPAEGSAAACSSPPGDCSAHTAGERNQKYYRLHERPKLGRAKSRTSDPLPFTSEGFWALLSPDRWGVPLQFLLPFMIQTQVHNQPTWLHQHNTINKDV